MVDGFVLGLGNFQHDRPIWSLLSLRRSRVLAISKLLCGQLGVLLRLVVGRVIGEDGGTVERAIVLRKVELRQSDFLFFFFFF